MQMIVAALIAAEPVLHLAEAIDDPEKYLYVTDSVIEDIERSKDPVSLCYFPPCSRGKLIYWILLN